MLAYLVFSLATARCILLINDNGLSSFGPWLL